MRYAGIVKNYQIFCNSLEIPNLIEFSIFRLFFKLEIFVQLSPMTENIKTIRFKAPASWLSKITNAIVFIYLFTFEISWGSSLSSHLSEFGFGRAHSLHSLPKFPRWIGQFIIVTKCNTPFQNMPKKKSKTYSELLFSKTYSYKISCVSPILLCSRVACVNLYDNFFESNGIRAKPRKKIFRFFK